MCEYATQSSGGKKSCFQMTEPVGRPHAVEWIRVGMGIVGDIEFLAPRLPSMVTPLLSRSLPLFSSVTRPLIRFLSPRTASGPPSQSLRKVEPTVKLAIKSFRGAIEGNSEVFFSLSSLKSLYDWGGGEMVPRWVVAVR